MSLQRILEPEVMDSPEEAQDYDSMDHSSVNQLFVDDLLKQDSLSGDILDLGTGTAQIPILLCEQLDSCRIMAVDLATHMLDLARFNIEAASLIERIQLDRIDAKSLGYSNGMFDVVMSNSIIHHIPEPAVCLAEAVRVTKAGGLLFFRDLMRPESTETLEALVQTYAGDQNDHQQKMFRESLHAALSLDEIRQLVSDLGFEPETVQATSDRHWTWNATKLAS